MCSTQGRCALFKLRVVLSGCILLANHSAVEYRLDISEITMILNMLIRSGWLTASTVEAMWGVINAADRVHCRQTLVPTH